MYQFIYLAIAPITSLSYYFFLLYIYVKRQWSRLCLSLCSEKPFSFLPFPHIIIPNNPFLFELFLIFTLLIAFCHRILDINLSLLWIIYKKCWWKSHHSISLFTAVFYTLSHAVLSTDRHTDIDQRTPSSQKYKLSCPISKLGPWEDIQKGKAIKIL